MKRYYWLVSMSLILVVMLAGCGGGSAVTEWTATAEVQGNTALIAVTVPGKKLGTDFHPHMRLNGGPEVMLYSPTYTFSNLKPGAYKVTLLIADKNHNPLKGFEAKELLFDIK